MVVKSVYPLAYVQVNQAQHVETNGYRIPCGESVNGVLRKTSLKRWSGGGIQIMTTILAAAPTSWFTLPASDEPHSSNIPRERKAHLQVLTSHRKKATLLPPCADGITELLIVFEKCKSTKKSVLSDIAHFQESW